MSSQALELISAAASNASSARAEYTTAAPALTETATPSTSASSCLVAPRSRAAVAAQRNGNSKRYEFAGLFIEVTGLLAGPAEGGVALDDIGVELAEAADPGEKLLPICIPIQHVHDALLFDAM